MYICRCTIHNYCLQCLLLRMWHHCGQKLYPRLVEQLERSSRQPRSLFQQDAYSQIHTVSTPDAGHTPFLIIPCILRTHEAPGFYIFHSSLMLGGTFWMAFVSRLHKHPLIRAQSATACRSVHALGSKKEDKEGRIMSYHIFDLDCWHRWEFHRFCKGTSSIPYFVIFCDILCGKYIASIFDVSPVKSCHLGCQCLFSLSLRWGLRISSTLRSEKGRESKSLEPENMTVTWHQRSLIIRYR